jgi:hypothetical protein
MRAFAVKQCLLVLVISDAMMFPLMFTDGELVLPLIDLDVCL